MVNVDVKIIKIDKSTLVPRVTLTHFPFRFGKVIGFAYKNPKKMFGA